MKINKKNRINKSDPVSDLQYTRLKSHHGIPTLQHIGSFTFLILQA